MELSSLSPILIVLSRRVVRVLVTLNDSSTWDVGSNNDLKRSLLLDSCIDSYLVIYPLVAPNVRPAIKCFCMVKNSTTGGIAATTAPADINCQDANH